MKTLALIAVLALVALAGCGGNGDDSGSTTLAEAVELTVAEAAEADHEGPAAVTGYLVADAGGVRLCEALAESFPPQCGVASIAVEGLDPASVEGIVEAEGVSWTDGQIELEGVLSDGVLTVSDNVEE